MNHNPYPVRLPFAIGDTQVVQAHGARIGQGYFSNVPLKAVA